MPIAFISDVSDSFETFFVHDRGHFFIEPRFVNLIGNLSHNDDIAVLTLTLDRSSRAHGELASSGLVCVTNPTAAVNNSCRREIRSWNVSHQLGKRRLRMIDEVNHGLADFAKV